MDNDIEQKIRGVLKNRNLFHGTSLFPAEINHLTARLSALLSREMSEAISIAKDAIRLAGDGDYSNGNTDCTGSIDEGRVRAGEFLSTLVARLKELTEKGNV